MVDQEFDVRARHYRRLRRIDCSELDTAEGKRAKSYMEKLLEKVSFVILTSTRLGKYGRYLADLFVLGKDADITRGTSVILGEAKDLLFFESAAAG